MMLFHGKIEPLSKNKRIVLFFKSFHGYVVLIGVINLILAFFYKLWWVNIPAKYEWMIGFGEILYNIELALVASCIFYFVTVYFPEEKKKKKIAPTIEFWLNQLVFIGNTILKDVAGCETIDVDDFGTKCQAIKMNNTPSQTFLYKTNLTWAVLLKSPNNIPKNWYDYFKMQFEEEDCIIVKLRPYWGYLPEETIVNLDDIQFRDRCRIAVSEYEYNYKNKINIGDVSVDWTNLGGISHILWLHCKLLQNMLKTYQEGNI